MSIAIIPYILGLGAVVATVATVAAVTVDSDKNNEEDFDYDWKGQGETMSLHSQTMLDTIKDRLDYINKMNTTPVPFTDTIEETDKIGVDDVYVDSANVNVNVNVKPDKDTDEEDMDKNVNSNTNANAKPYMDVNANVAPDKYMDEEDTDMDTDEEDMDKNSNANAKPYMDVNANSNANAKPYMDVNVNANSNAKPYMDMDKNVNANANVNVAPDKYMDEEDMDMDMDTDEEDMDDQNMDGKVEAWERRTYRRGDGGTSDTVFVLITDLQNTIKNSVGTTGTLQTKYDAMEELFLDMDSGITEFISFNSDNTELSDSAKYNELMSSFADEYSEILDLYLECKSDIDYMASIVSDIDNLILYTNAPIPTLTEKLEEKISRSVLNITTFTEFKSFVPEAMDILPE